MCTTTTILKVTHLISCSWRIEQLEPLERFEHIHYVKLCSGSSSANQSGLGLGSEEVGMQKFPYIVPLIVVCMASWVSQGAAQDKKLEKDSHRYSRFEG